MEAFKKSLSEMVSRLADGAYTRQPCADGVAEMLGAKIEIAKHNELHTFKVMPQRWIVERSFGWLEKCKRFGEICEHQLNISLQLVNFFFPHFNIVLKRFRTGSQKYPVDDNVKRLRGGTALDNQFGNFD